MSVATVVTRGYGSFGSVNLLPTLGYGAFGGGGGAVYVPGEWPRIIATRQDRRAAALFQEKRASAPIQVRRATDPKMGE